MATTELEAQLLGDVKKTLLPRRIDFVEARTAAGKFAQGHTKFKPINPFAVTSATPSQNPFGTSPDDQDTDESSSSEPTPGDLLEMFWANRGQRASGFVNFGNTCYLNSALQCLVHTSPLANLLLGHSEFSKECGLRSKSSSKFCFLCELQAVVRKSFSAKYKAVSPKDLVHSGLPLLGRQFRNIHKQQDSHEFIHLMLDRLEKDCVQHRSIRGVFAGYNLAPKRPDGDSAKPKETTLPFAIFGGYFQSQVKCTACSYESNTYDPYMDLSLEIKGASVDSALKHHTASEILEGDNKYLCPRCKKKQKAVKQLTVYKAPNVLMVHMKRFTWHGSKISKPVQFEAHLNLDKFMSTNRVANKGKEDNKYELYGVSCHVGGASSGHYYAYVRTPAGTWACMDDSSASNVGIERVLGDTQAAYIMFYMKAQPKRPQSVFVADKKRPAAPPAQIPSTRKTETAPVPIVSYTPVVIEEPNPKLKRKDSPVERATTVAAPAPVAASVSASDEIGVIFSAPKKAKLAEATSPAQIQANHSKDRQKQPQVPPRPKIDVAKQLMKNQKDGKGTIYGARVQNWGAIDGAAEIISAQRAVMREHAAETKPKHNSEWDAEYDRGRTPKRKNRDEDDKFASNKKAKSNRFQSLHDKKKNKHHHDARDRKNKGSKAEQARFMKKVHRQKIR